MKDVRWIGREGEKIFSLLCSRRQVTCNKAEEDDRGYDFILHFPPSAIRKLPIDQRPVGATALVQIKATRIDAQRWSISLKNALNLARSPLPAFIVCVGLEEDGKETFRAIHLWTAEIARILKAARQAHVEGDEAINRRTISFEFGAATTRADPIGWMEASIGEVGETSYAAAKQHLVDTLGFEDGHGTVQFSLSTASQDAFVDLQLGIIESLEVDSFSYTPSRFGIDSPKPDFEARQGKIEILPQGRKATIRLRTSSGEQAFLPAELFSAGLPGSRRTKGRVKTECLEMIIRPRKPMSIKCRLAEDARTSLDTIGAYALLRDSTRAKPLHLSMKTNGAFDELGHVNMTQAGDKGWRQLYNCTEALRKLIAFEAAAPFETSLEEMNAQFVPLSVLDALVAARAMRIEFVPIEEVAGTVGAYLAYTVVAFGEFEIGAVASRPVVADEMIASMRRIDFGPASILHASVNDGCAGDLHDRYLDELDRISERVDVLAIGDLQKAVSRDAERILVVDQPRAVPRRRLAVEKNWTSAPSESYR